MWRIRKGQSMGKRARRVEHKIICFLKEKTIVAFAV